MPVGPLPQTQRRMNYSVVTSTIHLVEITIIIKANFFVQLCNNRVHHNLCHVTVLKREIVAYVQIIILYSQLGMIQLAEWVYVGHGSPFRG